MCARQIIDCFTFFNELDLLELRLETLDPVVDRFVLAEARYTFQGHSKTCLFEENKARFRRFLPKIEHVIVDAFAATENSWHREAEQRDAMNAAVAQCDDDDIIMLSDVDEIPHPDAVVSLRTPRDRRCTVYCFELACFEYFMNLRCPEPWLRQSPRAVRKANFPGMQNLRLIRGPAKGKLRDAVRGLRAWRTMGRAVRRITLRDAGWHFSWLGDRDAAIAKMRAISTHSDMGTSPEALAKFAREERNRVLRDSGDYRLVEIDQSFPAALATAPERWARYILTDAARAEEITAGL